jgi:hypothetical protein
VWTRAQDPASAIRLQINWLNAEGHELDPSTASLEVVPVDPTWMLAEATFRAPPESTEGHVYAVAQQGRAWLDDYSLQNAPDGCNPRLEAIPNPVPAGAHSGASAIDWNTGDGTPGQVWVSSGHGPEALLAQGPHGSQVLNDLESNEVYSVRLYSSTAHQQLLDEISVQVSEDQTQHPN